MGADRAASPDLPRFGRKRVAGPKDTLVLIGPGAEARQSDAPERWPKIGDFAHAPQPAARPGEPPKAFWPPPPAWAAPPAPTAPFRAPSPPGPWDAAPSYEPPYGLPPWDMVWAGAPALPYPQPSPPLYPAPPPGAGVPAGRAASPRRTDPQPALRRTSVPSPSRAPSPLYGYMGPPGHPGAPAMEAAYRPMSPPWPYAPAAAAAPVPGLQELAAALLQSLLLLQAQGPPPNLSADQYARLLEAVQRAAAAKEPPPAPTAGPAAPSSPPTPRPRRRDGDEEPDLRQPPVVRPSVAAYDSASEESYDWHAVRAAAARRLAGRGTAPPGEGGRGGRPGAGPPPRWSRPSPRPLETAERSIIGGGFMTPSSASSPRLPQRLLKGETPPKRMTFEQMFPPRRKLPLTREVPPSDPAAGDGSHLPPSDGQSPAAAFIAQRFQARRQQLQEWHEKADAEWHRLRNQRLGVEPGWKDTESASEMSKRPDSPRKSSPPPLVEDAAAEDGPIRLPRRVTRRASPSASKLTPNPKFFASTEPPPDSRNVIVIRSFGRVADPPHRRESVESPTPPLSSADPVDAEPDGPLRVTVRAGSLASTSSLSRFVETFIVPQPEPSTPPPPLPPSDSDSDEGSDDGRDGPRPAAQQASSAASPVVSSPLIAPGHNSDSGDSPRLPSFGRIPRPRTRSPSPASRSSPADPAHTLRHIPALAERVQAALRPSAAGLQETEHRKPVVVPRFVRMGDLDITSGAMDEEATNTDPTAGDATSDGPATLEEDAADAPAVTDSAAATTTVSTLKAAGPSASAPPSGPAPQPSPPHPPRATRPVPNRLAPAAPLSDTDEEPWSNPVSEEVPPRGERRWEPRPAPRHSVVMEGRAVLHRGRAGNRTGPADTCSSLSLSDVSDSEPATVSASGRGVTPLKPTLVWPFDSDDDGSLDSLGRTPPKARPGTGTPSPAKPGEARSLSPAVPTPTTLSQLLMEKARVQASWELTQNLLDCLDAL